MDRQICDKKAYIRMYLGLFDMHVVWFIYLFFFLILRFFVVHLVSDPRVEE